MEPAPVRASDKTLSVMRKKSLCKPGHVAARSLCVRVGFGFPAALWNSGRRGTVQHAQQKQTWSSCYIPYFRTSRMMRPQISSKALVAMLRHQLLQAGQAKFLTSGISHFRYTVGNHREEIACGFVQIPLSQVPRRDHSSPRGHTAPAHLR